MMKHSILLLLPLLSLAFHLKSELSENCHKKTIFCLQNLKRLNCQNPESFTVCAKIRCSIQEIKVLVIMLCHVNSALSNIEATSLSKHCSSAFRNCWSQALPPLLLLLDRGETFAALCHAVSSEEFKDCLSGECNKPEKIIMITRSCNPWNEDKVSVDAIRRICYTDVLKCLENVTSPSCLTIKHAETCLRRGCYKAEIETIEVLMCTTHKTLSLYTNRIDEEIPVCGASNCNIKADLPVSLWMSPTELNSRICAGQYPKWESCIDPTSTECSPQKIQAIVRDTCMPSMYLDVRESCEQHFDEKLASLHEHTCQTVRSVEDSLREKCTENEIEILLAGSCETLRHLVFIHKHLMDSAPRCYERLLICKMSYVTLDKLYDPRSYSRNFCWFLSLKSFERCLTSRQLEDSLCDISSMRALISAGCRCQPGVLTKSCSQHALVCIHGNIRSCEDINAQENCLLEMCTGIEAKHVVRESCTTMNYLATLIATAAEVPLECGQKIYYCLSNLHFPNYEWLPSSKVEQQFCQVINTDIFIRCSLERCLLKEVNMFVKTACIHHFDLLQSIPMDCAAQIKQCGSLSLEAACAGLSGMEQCVKQSGQCSPTEIRQIIHQACRTLEAEDGFFLASQALPPDCAVTMLNCVNTNETLQAFQATSADFCAYILSDVFKQCISSSCNNDDYNQTLKASCYQTAILYKVKPPCYHRAMICFNSSTCLEADVNHNCLGSACTSFENILVRDNFCKTERYIKRLKSVFEDTHEHCMSLFLECALGAQITVDMRFDLKSLQDLLCQSSAKEDARQCYVSGADCKESCYELASVLACSPAGELASSIDDACIIHLGSCLQLSNAASCADVVANHTCISQKCNEVATAHVTGRACESMSFVESIVANIEVSNTFCREQLQRCLQYHGFPITYWLDVNMFRRRVCHTTFAESFKMCLLEKCSKAPIKQISFAACDFRARIFGLEALSACSVFTADIKFVTPAVALPFLSRWL